MRLNWDQVLNLTGKIKFNFGTAHSAAVFVNIISDDGGVISEWKSPAEPFESTPGEENDHTVGHRTTVNGFYNRIYSDDMVLKLRAGGYWNNWDTYGVDPEFSREDRYFAESQLNTTWSGRLTSITGLTVVYNGIDGQMFGKHNSHSLAGYALAQQKWRAFTLSLGGRWEAYQVDGESRDQMFTPQAALNWNPLPWVALRASSGKGFRVPTVAEMFTSTQRSIFRVEPNPTLVSEHSDARELGFSVMTGGTGRLDGLKFDAALFLNDFSNLIEPTPDSLGIIHFENIADARIRGADIGLGASLMKNLFTLKSAFTWLDPLEVDAAGNSIDTLSYRYRHHWVSAAGFHLADWDITAEYRYSSRIESVELYQENLLTGQDKRVPVHVWNLGIGYQRDNWELLLRVNNLFQYYYTQLERNMTEERLTTITLRRRF